MPVVVHVILYQVCFNKIMYVSYKGTIFNNPYDRVNLYGEDIEIDYRGNEVTVNNFIRVLTGRLPTSTPSSKRLNTDEDSNILIYITGLHYYLCL